MTRPHRNYDEEFRRSAVELLLSSSRPLKRVAAELGVAANSLRSWRDKQLGKGRGTAVAVHGYPDAVARNLGRVGEVEICPCRQGNVLRGGSPQTVADPAAEIRRLQRENEYLRRQREILKKAASILAEDPQLGMR